MGKISNWEKIGNGFMKMFPILITISLLHFISLIIYVIFGFAISSGAILIGVGLAMLIDEQVLRKKK